MRENKKLRKQRESLHRRASEHRIKVADENRRPNPDFDRIRHWEKEIANWLRQIDEIDHKLGKE